MLEIIKNFNEFFWGVILIVLLVGTGVFYTFRLKFIQVREFKSGLKQLTSGFDLSGEKADNNGMSSFQEQEISQERQQRLYQEDQGQYSGCG